MNDSKQNYFLKEGSKCDYFLKRGLELKHAGYYEEAKEMYIQAIYEDHTFPNCYLNLGKILYILEEYESSARAYKVGYERNLNCISAQGTLGPLVDDRKAIFRHLGHALIDKQNYYGKNKIYIDWYLDGINPKNVKGFVCKPTYDFITPSNQKFFKQVEAYDNKCIEAAKKYIKEAYQ